VSRRAYIKQRFVHHSSHLVQRQSVETIQSLPLVIWRITNYSVRCSNQAETQKNNGMEQKSNHTQAPSGAPLIPRVLLCNNCRGDSSPDPRYYLLLRLLLRQELLGVAQPHICLFLQSEETIISWQAHLEQRMMLLLNMKCQGRRDTGVHRCYTIYSFWCYVFLFCYFGMLVCVIEQK
jgi:hypothetical protein